LPQPHLPFDLLHPQAPQPDARPPQLLALQGLLALPEPLARPPELVEWMPSRRKPCRKRSTGALERLEWFKKCAQTPQPHAPSPCAASPSLLHLKLERLCGFSSCPDRDRPPSEVENHA
jgi:hypothetical protein